MSGHFLHSCMKISVDTVNYLIFLVCMNDVDILVDKNKIIIYSTFDYVALYLLILYHKLFSVTFKNYYCYFRVHLKEDP